MFNLKQHNAEGNNDIQLLENEIRAFGIHPVKGGRFEIEVGDDVIRVNNLRGALSLIQDSVYELGKRISLQNPIMKKFSQASAIALSFKELYNRMVLKRLAPTSREHVVPK